MKQMSSWLNVNSFNEKDEYYTPTILVNAIVPYIPANTHTIWCPFDTENSEFVRVFRSLGYKVICSHIWNGQDFFSYEPPEPYDCIISNPPFSKKLQVFARLYELDKPFAMVCGLPILNYQVIGEFFVGRDLQLLIVDKKVSFDGNTASFNNSYFCRKFLPRDIIFQHIAHNNTGANFTASSMAQDFESRGDDE